MKVAKFGGTSLADANQFKKVANIIKEDKRRKFIVVSAPGKRHSHDYKMTDLLIQLGEAYINQDKYKSYYITIMDRFYTIINQLHLPDSLLNEIEDKIKTVMENDLNKEDKINCFKAIGEDCSAKILNAYLNTLGLESEYINPKEAGIIIEKTPTGTQILPESFPLIHR